MKSLITYLKDTRKRLWYNNNEESKIIAYLYRFHMISNHREKKLDDTLKDQLKLSLRDGIISYSYFSFIFFYIFQIILFVDVLFLFFLRIVLKCLP